MSGSQVSSTGTGPRHVLVLHVRSRGQQEKWGGYGQVGGLGRLLPPRTLVLRLAAVGRDIGRCTHIYDFNNMVGPHWETLNPGPVLGSRARLCLPTLGNCHPVSECLL